MIWLMSFGSKNGVRSPCGLQSAIHIFSLVSENLQKFVSN